MTGAEIISGSHLTWCEVRGGNSCPLGDPEPVYTPAWDEGSYETVGFCASLEIMCTFIVGDATARLRCTNTNSTALPLGLVDIQLDLCHVILFSLRAFARSATLLGSWVIVLSI